MHSIITCAIIIVVALIVFKIVKKLFKAIVIGVVAGIVYYLLANPEVVSDIFTQVTTALSK